MTAAPLKFHFVYSSRVLGWLEKGCSGISADFGFNYFGNETLCVMVTIVHCWSTMQTWWKW